MYRVFKTVFVLAITICMLFMSEAFAAPESLPAGVNSTKYGLVTLKVPQYIVSTTNSKRIAVSAAAPQGTTVTLYRYDQAAGIYKKAYTDGIAVEGTVGNTRLFARQVDLAGGVNKFIIRGTASDGTYTVVRFEVTLLNEEFMTRIKSVIDINF